MFIGITQRLICNQSYFEERETLALDWGRLFNLEIFSGFLPLSLSYEIDFSMYEKHLSAVILSGGNDLSIYDHGALSCKRDDYEKKIIEYCLKTNTPLLGICRGAQMIAHYFDSSLNSCINHIGNHEILLNDGANCVVNSFHNYAISALGKDLISLAKASDKSIEAFKHKDKNIYGIMWHIERENGLENVNILKEWLNLIKEKQ
ncbi:gamma-glutamyl-CDP-amidate hydrolase [Campylobacter sp. 2457A]|uniref:gamma-glutamyl-CDP-amidate hydrolase n=1 Tax=Campylobacter sp. 2457A TaxID=2735784 RepID=UPI00301C3435|nr:gamma-glutamyl-gamma-aminobutyrate hydrolase family protein [Campylobacter sp. 2457A]